MKKIHYKGDLTRDLVSGQRMGPNTYGEFLYVKFAHYDVATDKTTVGLTYIVPTTAVAA